MPSTSRKKPSASKTRIPKDQGGNEYKNSHTPDDGMPTPFPTSKIDGIGERAAEAFATG
jgi:hypothetical protein